MAGHTTLRQISQARLVRDQRGLTLLDLAIALILVSLLALPLISQYERWRDEQDRNNIDAIMTRAENAIERFYFGNDRYPCPADPVLATDDPLYGSEQFNPGTQTCIDVATGAPVDPVADPDAVVQGMVPFRALGLPEKDAYDVWNRRLTYAVTAAMASDLFDAEQFGQDTSQPGVVFTPAISIQVHDDESGIVDHDNGQFIIVSHGESGAGGLTRAALLVEECPGDDSLDGENCDGDELFVDSIGIAFSLSGGQDGDRFYDDVIRRRGVEVTSLPTQVWQPENPLDSSTQTNYSRVGIGVNNPVEELDVAGNIRVGNGNIQVANICDENGENCFPVEAITGDGSIIRCHDGQGFATGIALSKAQCDPSTIEYFNPASHGRNCAALGSKYFMNGIAADGLLNCCNVEDTTDCQSL